MKGGSGQRIRKYTFDSQSVAHKAPGRFAQFSGYICTGSNGGQILIIFHVLMTKNLQIVEHGTPIPRLLRTPNAKINKAKDKSFGVLNGLGIGLPYSTFYANASKVRKGFFGCYCCFLVDSFFQGIPT